MPSFSINVETEMSNAKRQTRGDFPSAPTVSHHRLFS